MNNYIAFKKNKVTALIIIFIFLIGICIIYPPNTYSTNMLEPFISFITGEMEHKRCCEMKSCTNAIPNVNLTLKEEDIFTYEKILLFKVGEDVIPITLKEVYTIKEVDHFNTKTCYTIASFVQYPEYDIETSKQFGMKEQISLLGPTIKSLNETILICDNSNACNNTLPFSHSLPFSPYILSLNKEFIGIIEYNGQYNVSQYLVGYKIKGTEENFTLKTTYSVIGEENIGGINCYKVKITEERMCNEKNHVCNDSFSILWADKKRRIVIQHEYYRDNELTEKLRLLNTSIY